jgi:hypothetical protein
VGRKKVQPVFKEFLPRFTAGPLYECGGPWAKYDLGDPLLLNAFK